MNKPNMICRVCGNEYYCCGDSKAINSWRAMSCSVECFKEYMRRIDEARSPKPIKGVVNEVVEEIKTETTSIKTKHGKKKVAIDVDKNETT